MNPVRPPVFQSAAPVKAPAASNARAAFFQTATSQAAPAPAAQPVRAALPVQKALSLPDEPPQKILRPGSLLDIRV